MSWLAARRVVGVCGTAILGAAVRVAPLVVVDRVAVLGLGARASHSAELRAGDFTTVEIAEITREGPPPRHTRHSEAHLRNSVNG